MSSGACTPIELSDDGNIALAREGVWQRGHGWVSLPDLAGGANDNTPMALSGDGRVVYGSSGSSLGAEVYRWVVDGEFEGLGKRVEAPPRWSRSLDTNADGEMMVGCFGSGLSRWTRAHGFESIDPFEEGCAPGLFGPAALLSSDSRTIVSSTEPDIALFILSSITPSSNPPAIHQYPTAVTGDGTRIATNSQSFSGAQGLGDQTCLLPQAYPFQGPVSGLCLPNAVVVEAFDHAGTAAVGQEYFGWGGVHAPVGTFYWAPDQGVRFLSDTLFSRGVYVDVGFFPAAVSADGQTVLGRGTRHFIDGTSTDECFVATLGDDPGTEPGGEEASVDFVAAGGSTTCAITHDGAVWCWGSGALPFDSSRRSRSWSPVKIPGLPSRAARVAADDDHSCAILATGAVHCWGNNAFGQLGDGTLESSNTAVAVSAISTAIQISVRGTSSCAVLADRTVRCWGAGAHGQLGNDTVVSSSVPVAVSGLTNVVQIAHLEELCGSLLGFFSEEQCSRLHADKQACALLADGSVWCWGGFVPEEYPGSTVPVALEGVAGVRQISTGTNHLCLLLDAGQVTCRGPMWWGVTMSGGSLPSDNVRIVPDAGESDQISTLSFAEDAEELADGIGYTCARRASGTLQCHGWNLDGELGTGDRAYVRTSRSPSLAAATQIVAGHSHTCARLTSGGLYCWGRDQAGQIGIGRAYDNYSFDRPQRVRGMR